MTIPVGTAATQRIITVLQVLADHPKRGINVYDLLSLVGSYNGTDDGQRDQLSRDLRHLRREGFVIDNVADEGEEARYVLRPGDDRVRVAFTPEQLFELQRAAVLVGVDGLASLVDGRGAEAGSAGPIIGDLRVPAALGEVQRAVTTRAKVRFEYSGRTRTIHPYGLRMAPRGWVLEGWEEESGQAKVLSLQKMVGVRIDRPGTASPPERAVRPTLDPLRYQLDDPVEAVLQVPVRFRSEVDAMLRHPLRAEPGPVVEGDATELLYHEVTNHTNFLVRVLRLDERVVLLGGKQLRKELRQMLVRIAEVH